MAASIDWYYRRNNCKTCEKADTYLEEHEVEPKTVVDARKETQGKADALALAKTVDTIITTRGKSYTTLDLKTKPDQEAILDALLGPTGNLRAPTFRKGRTLFVGFHPDGYDEVLGLG